MSLARKSNCVVLSNRMLRSSIEVRLDLESISSDLCLILILTFARLCVSKLIVLCKLIQVIISVLLLNLTIFLL